jgi:membrane protein implicated in regulation of membrane protease activity
VAAQRGGVGWLGLEGLEGFFAHPAVSNTNLADWLISFATSTSCSVVATMMLDRGRRAAAASGRPGVPAMQRRRQMLGGRVFGVHREIAGPFDEIWVSFGSRCEKKTGWCGWVAPCLHFI